MAKWKPIETAPLVALRDMGSTPMVLTCIRSGGKPLGVQVNKHVERYGWMNQKEEWTHWMELSEEFEESSDE